MAELSVQSPIHPDLHVAHATPGRLRLRAPGIRGKPLRAAELAEKLSTVPGVQRAHADSTTGSVTVHYHVSALKSAEFFAETAAALGMVAVGLEPGEVEAMLRLVGVSPTELRAAWGDNFWPLVAVPVAFFALGFAVGRRLA
jgi:hypothetical protein